MENLPYIFGQLAQLLASYARIEGLKALNQERLIRGESLAYGEEPFFQEAELMGNIAQNLQQL